MNENFFITEHQVELAKRYSWSIPRNVWTGKIIEDYKYEYGTVFYDEMPTGWGWAFGDELMEEIDKALKASKLKDFMITQVKEKYGELRIYTSAVPQTIYDIIEKYTEISRHTCVKCGAPAKMYDNGWMCPYCEKHIPENAVCIEEDPLD